MNNEIEISNKYRKHIKEDRGIGEGADYIPWTKINEFSSKGRATRIMGIKTKRIHHFHSDNQLRAFLIFEWSNKVTDIRECYPLLDLMETVDDKDNLALDKFSDSEPGNQFVITTNFLLTLREPDEKIKYIARAIKNCSELNKKITIEKLEIEKRYWRARGIEFKVITDKELDRQLCKNIQWVRETLLDNSGGVEEKDKLSTQLYFHLSNNKGIIVKDVLKDFESRYDVVKGTALYLFRYLLAIKRITMDMTQPINFNITVMKLLKFFEED
ncbi:TnsA endonuclease N-terminal domain-containing protein [Candidatus Clostridium helianthi]|jgi:hypothetical protein|uniref:TnsA endonuclease N-terminal domain-containing protein n=1 Tax=Candidatus Clostridium helianthi TaxID=3381660 RepID=A0ABW8RZB1_9CLOT